MDSDNPGAGEGDGFGLARFGQGGENIRGVEVKVGDPQFTLIWDTEADLDLHVIEPGGKEIYWEEPRGRQGGELDVDNTKGLRPREHLLAPGRRRDRRDQGQGGRASRRVQVVRRLLGRVRGDRPTHALEGPDQARGQGHRRDRQVQDAQRAEPHLHLARRPARRARRRGQGHPLTCRVPIPRDCRNRLRRSPLNNRSR